MEHPGLKRTNEDKRRAVLILLKDPEWQMWSDRRIACHAGVSNTFVAKLRHEAGAKCSVRITADGRSFPAGQRMSRKVKRENADG